MGALIVVAIVNLPSLWTGAFVDPALERDESPPAAWTDAAADLDSIGDTGRVLQLPGAEFGAFRWGYTVDQPLPGLTDKPLITRDLLPLGSAGAMDLLYALDDRIQRLGRDRRVVADNAFDQRRSLARAKAAESDEGYVRLADPWWIELRPEGGKEQKRQLPHPVDKQVEQHA